MEIDKTNIFRNYGVEVEIEESDFLKIVETLTRIGVFSRKNNTLYQSVHLLHKQGRYSVLHFKELFALDGKLSDISDNDLARRNTIVSLLEEWELLSIKDKHKIKETVPISEIKILSYKDKDKVELVSKYNIGKIKK